MSLRIKLFMATAVTLVIFIWLLAFLLTQQIEKTVFLEVSQAMDARTHQAALTIDYWFVERRHSIEAFASELERRQIEFDTANLKSDMIAFTDRFKEQFINGMFIGFANKSMVSVRNSSGKLSGFDPTVRPWYREAIKCQQPIITEPYTDFVTGRQVVTLAVPLKGLAVPGVLSTDLYLEDLKGIAEKIRFHPLAQIAFLSKNGQIIYDPDGVFSTGQGENILEHSRDFEQSINLQTMFSQESGFFYYQEPQENRGYQVFHTYVPSTGWVIMTRIPETVFYEASHQLRQYAFGASIFAIILALLFSSFIVRRLTLPLEAISQVAREIGNGNIHISFPSKGTTEIQGLAGCLEGMRNEILTLLRNKDQMICEVNANKEEIQSLYQQMVALNDELTKAFQEKDLANMSTIKALADAVEAKDAYTRGHSERVLEYSLAIGRKLELGERDLELLSYAAILHDIGKIGVPLKILNKPGKLNASEYEMIQRHPQIGYKIIQNINYLSEVGEAVFQHHEWFNGQGYPQRLQGAMIHPIAQILAVADAYDAMTSFRAYREPLLPKEACAELQAKAGTQFSPMIVSTFSEIIADRLIIHQAM